MSRKSLAALLSLVSALASGALIAYRASAIAVAQDRPHDPTHVEVPDAAARTPQDVTRRAQVITRVYDSAITVGDVEDALASQSPYLRQRYTDPVHMRELIDNLVRFRLLAHEAEKRGFGRDKTVVHAVKTDAVQAMLRHEIDERVTMQSVPDADVHGYYDSHMDEFHHDEMRRASHILVETREEALSLVPQLREADARTFRELASQRSLDTESKLRGGDLRFFARHARPNTEDAQPEEAIVAAVFALHAVGDVSDPVQVGTEWSVIKLTGIRPEETRRFEDAQAGIRMRIWRERRQAALDTFVSGLRERFHPELHEDRVDAIRLDPLPAGDNMPGFPANGAPGAAGTIPPPTKAPAPAGGH